MSQDAGDSLAKKALQLSDVPVLFLVMLHSTRKWAIAMQLREVALENHSEVTGDPECGSLGQ